MTSILHHSEKNSTISNRRFLSYWMKFWNALYSLAPAVAEDPRLTFSRVSVSLSGGTHGAVGARARVGGSNLPITLSEVFVAWVISWIATELNSWLSNLRGYWRLVPADIPGAEVRVIRKILVLALSSGLRVRTWCCSCCCQWKEGSGELVLVDLTRWIETGPGTDWPGDEEGWRQRKVVPTPTLLLAWAHAEKEFY